MKTRSNRGQVCNPMRTQKGKPINVTNFFFFFYKRKVKKNKNGTFSRSTGAKRGRGGERGPLPCGASALFGAWATPAISTNSLDSSFSNLLLLLLFPLSFCLVCFKLCFSVSGAENGYGLWVWAVKDILSLPITMSWVYLGQESPIENDPLWAES